MAAITVANTDWAILDGLKEALAGATLQGSGDVIFPTVYITPSEVEFRQAQMVNRPVAAIRYLTTEEEPSVDGEKLLCLRAEVHVGTMVEGDDGVDETDRVKEALRLVNAAKNAIETSPPADAESVGDDDFYVRKIDWGDPEIDLTSNKPWAVAVLAVSLGYSLASGTTH